MSKTYYIPEIELVYKTGLAEKKKITDVQSAVNILRELFNKDTLLLTEEFILLILNRANKTIAWVKIAQGGLDFVVPDLRMIYIYTLKAAGTGIIVAHNHPSGNINPSEADKKMAEKLKKGCEILDIILLDSIILTDESYCSFKEEGII